MLAAMWLLIWLGTSIASKKKATAERFNRMVTEANFADWSGNEGAKAEAEKRRNQLGEVANVLNRMDLREREIMREKNVGNQLFERLSPKERIYFLDLTLTESMKRMMDSFDQMAPKERQKFVERALKNMKNGRDGDDLAKLEQEDPAVVDKMVSAGMSAFYEDASAETKLDLVPLIDAFSEMMQGFSGGMGGR